MLGTPVRGTLKGALATLVLLLLALLFWLVIAQTQDTLEQKRQYSINYSADLADRVNLNMALQAEVALNLLPIDQTPGTQRQQQALTDKLRQSLPSVQSLALLSPRGEVLLDSNGISPDAAFLADWIQQSQTDQETEGYFYSHTKDCWAVYKLMA